MNQDGLENFFGCVRSCCHNSLSLIATHFRASFTTVFMNNLSSHSIKSNCEPDSSIPFLTDIHRLILQNNNAQTGILTNTHHNILQNNNGESNTTDYVEDNTNSHVTNIVDEFENENYDPIIFEPQFSECELNSINEEAISNLSKLVFDKLLEATKCDECRLTLLTSKNGIKFPSNAFFKNFENVFCIINESLQYICAENFLKKKILNSLQNVELKEMGCREHLTHIKKKIYGVLYHFWYKFIL